MRGQGGNILVIVLIAIVLVGLLTVAVRGTSPGQEHIDRENLIIQANQIIKTGAELETAVRLVLENGVSESDLRFAAPSAPAEYGVLTTTPSAQIFSRQGGAAEYRLAPAAILVGSDQFWEFYGTTAFPGVGSDAADLVALLPNVSPDFCAAVNKSVGLSGQPEDLATGENPDCVNGGAAYRFGAGFTFDSTPNVADAASFSKTPAMNGCIRCRTDGGLFHYFHVLVAR